MNPTIPSPAIVVPMPADRSVVGAVRGELLVQHLGLLAILDDREDQAADAETDHHQPDAARREEMRPVWGALPLLGLEELIDREAKRNQRRRRSDPRHQSAIQGNDCPGHREPGALIRQVRSFVGELGALLRELV